MSTELQQFDFDGTGVRVLADDQGNPQFVASDVAAILDYSASKDMTRLIDGDEKGGQIVPTLGGPQTMTVITEAGLYHAIMVSRSPKAKPFRRWVTHEVLPSIRKTGGYSSGRELPQSFAEALRALADETEARELEAQRRLALEAKAEADAPKVLFADAVAVSHSSILIGELAKLLRQNGIMTGQNRLFESLRRDGYLIRREGSDYNMPTQRAMEMGLFTVKETAITHSDGHTSVSKTPKVTGKGQQYFINRYMGGVAA